MTADPRFVEAPAPTAGVFSWRRLLALTTLFFVIGAGWSFSTAPGGSPDEIQHIFRAWTVWDGQVVLEPLVSGGGEADIPEGLITIGATKVTCFVYQTTVSAECGEPWPAQMGAEISTQAWVGRYNPAYYLAVGWPLKILSPLPAIYLMRLTAALMCAVVLALAAMSVCARTGAVLARAGVLVGLTPLAMFLAGTVNPSGGEVAGAVCGWVGVLLIARDPGHRAVPLWAASAGIGLSLMVLSRPASYLWLIPVGVVAAILLNRSKWSILLRRRVVWVAVAAVVLATGLQLLWTKIARTSDVELAGGADRTLRQGLVSAVSEVGGWWYQQVGVLGYLDTPPTASVVAATAASAIGLVLLALACTRGRERLAQLAAVLAALLVPMAAATVLYPSVGLVWQGRYILPLSVGAVVLAGILLDDWQGFDRRTRVSMARWFAALWAFAGIAMTFYNLQRYVVGDPTSYLFPFEGGKWSPPLPVLVCLAVTAIGYIGTVIYLLPRSVSREPVGPDVQDPSSSDGQVTVTSGAP